MTGTYVYRTPRPVRLPSDKHLCPRPRRGSVRLGDIWRCECGKYWQWGSLGMFGWARVRWYSFKAHQHIRAND